MRTSCTGDSIVQVKIVWCLPLSGTASISLAVAGAISMLAAIAILSMPGTLGAAMR